MPNNAELLISASVNQDQSTHNQVISNAAATLLIELVSKYLLNAADETQLSSSSSKASSMILIDISHQNTNDTINALRQRYATQDGSHLEQETLSWLKTKLTPGELNHSFDRVTLVQMQDGARTETEWYLPLYVVYPLVLSALYDLDETCWPVPEGSSPEIERNLRLVEFDRINNALASTKPAICPTGIRHSWLMALNGYKGNYLPLSEESVLHQALFDFMVHDILADKMGIILPDGRDPVNDEWQLFQSYFQGIFLPWILSGDMPDAVKTAIVEAGGSEAAAEKIRARFQAIGIAPDETKLASCCHLESLALLPCNFTPLLDELHGWINRHNNSPKQLISKTTEWLKGANDVEQIRFVMRFVDTLKLYKDNRLLIDSAELPREETLAWQSALSVMSTRLEDTESSPQQWLDNADLKQEILAFEKGYALWRTSSYKDFISNYFALWFANQDPESKSKLFVTLTKLYLRDTTKDETMPAIIHMSDERLSEWMAQFDNDKLLHLEPYQISRIFLHALCYPRKQWSDQFVMRLEVVIAFIEAGFNQAPSLVSEAIARDSWSQALIDDIKAIKEGRPIANPKVLTPTLITNESSLRASELLARASHLSSAVIHAIVNSPNFNPSATNDEGMSPLHYAAAYGHIQLAIALLHKDANPLQTFQGYTPLLAAVEFQSLSFVKDFLQAMPKSSRVEALTVKHDNDEELRGQTILHLMSHKRDYLQVLLELIPEDERLDAVMAKNKYNKTFLYSISNNFECLKLVLELIPEEPRLKAIMATDQDSNMLLHHASSNFECLKFVLDLMPEAPRLKAIMAKNNINYTLLNRIAHNNFQYLKLVLESMPEAQRHQAVMETNLLVFVKGKPDHLAMLYQLVPTIQEKKQDVVLVSGSSSSPLVFFAVGSSSESKALIDDNCYRKPGNSRD